MKLIKTDIPEVLIVETALFQDSRGFFTETYNERRWQEMTGLHTRFVQDNHSRSSKGVLRGLHYQISQAQGKLMRVIVGEVFDVAVDLRRSSATFGRWVGTNLSADNKRQLWIPAGFAHGFLVLSGVAELIYKTTDFYSPGHERSIIWNDPDLNINWPLDGEPLLSDKDAAAPFFRDAESFA